MTILALVRFTNACFKIFPARVVLVLIHDGSDVEMCRKLSAAMDNFFALVCSMNGQCRLPFFGLIALGTQPEVHAERNRFKTFLCLLDCYEM